MPPFQKAEIAIDENDNPIKVDNSQKANALYSGGCSCDNHNNTSTFLILGPTGAGKTTLVDSFLNFLLGIEMQDNFRYKLVDERKIEKERNQVLASQGQEVSEGSA